MPEIVTFSEMRSHISKNKSKIASLMKSSTYSYSSDDFDYKSNLFLSHSSKDKEFLSYVVDVLVKHGGIPYVDIGDNRLPSRPSKETAKILKDEIVKHPRFVVFVTTNSKESKWIPWELGIGDGAKRNYDIALFPSAENRYETDWLNQEYLGLYRRIVRGKIKGYKPSWIVRDHTKNAATTLKKWLNVGR